MRSGRKWSRGSISTLVPVKDGGKPPLAAEWGGTVISPNSRMTMLDAYVKSAERFRDIAIGRGADVMLTNLLTVAEECGKGNMLQAKARAAK